MDTTSKWFDYLHNTRQLSKAVINEAQLSEELGRLRIPVCDEAGNELFAKLRRPFDSEVGPKYTYQLGGAAALYGINFSDFGTDNFLTEGELDCLAVRSMGINAFSSTGGAMTFRKEWLGQMMPGRNTVICFDNDETGIKGAIKLAMMLESGTYTWVPPMYGKDASDLVMAVGLTKAKEILTDPARHIHFNLSASNQAENKRVVQKLGFEAHEMDNCVGKHFLLQLAFAFRIDNKPKAKRQRTQEFDNELQNAKAYPIENLLPFVNRKHKCLWHNEASASLHLYPDNSLFCHGSCNRQFDALDVYMHQHNVKLPEAIKALNNLK
jgi:DNA primase